jgi:hypothetical protein
MRAMSDIPPAILLKLSLQPESGLRDDIVVGQSVRVRLSTVDRALGTPVAATGVVITVAVPGEPVAVAYSGNQLTADGPGVWVLDVLADRPGGWRIRGECSGPRSAAREVTYWVRSSPISDSCHRPGRGAGHARKQRAHRRPRRPAA